MKPLILIIVLTLFFILFLSNTKAKSQKKSSLPNSLRLSKNEIVKHKNVSYRFWDAVLANGAGIKDLPESKKTWAPKGDYKQLSVCIIEPRDHPWLEGVLKNMAWVYGGSDEVHFFIFHGTHNEERVKNITTDWKNVNMVNLNVENLNLKEYNSLRKSKRFWENFKDFSEFVLMFETDSIILKKIEEEFFNYDIAGAPWIHSNIEGKLEFFNISEINGKVGNGGFCLRRVNTMIELALDDLQENNSDNFNYECNEDIFFCFKAKEAQKLMPSVEVANKFSVEHGYYPFPCGLHKVYNYFTVDPILNWFKHLEGIKRIDDEIGETVQNTQPVQNKKRVAVCFWGLCRSSKYTNENIKKYIFDELEKCGYESKVFLHTNTLGNKYSNKWSEDHEVSNFDTLWKLHNPDTYLIEPEENYKDIIDFNLYKTNSDYYESEHRETENIIKALYSLKMVTELVERDYENNHKFDFVVFCRPDLQILEPIPFETIFNSICFSTSQSKKVFTPNKNKYPINDRFAIMNFTNALIYGKRFDHLLQYITHSEDVIFHPETFLYLWLLKNKITIVTKENIKVRLVRSSGNYEKNYDSDGLPQMSIYTTIRNHSTEGENVNTFKDYLLSLKIFR